MLSPPHDHTGRERVIELDAVQSWIDGIAVITVDGDVDMLTSPKLYHATAVAIGQKPEGLVIDLTAVSLLSSAGMQVLINAHRMLDPSVGFAVVADGPATSKPLHIMGLADFITVVPTLDKALAYVRDRRPRQESPKRSG